MSPRRRRIPIALRSGVQPADLVAGEAFRPTMTGAFPRYRSMPSGATPMGSLSDPLSFVHDEDSEAPQLALL
jgi:hypothetical protein